MSIQYLVRSTWSNSRLKTVKQDASTTVYNSGYAVNNSWQQVDQGERSSSIVQLTGSEVELVVCGWIAMLAEIQHVHVSPSHTVHHGVRHRQITTLQTDNSKHQVPLYTNKHYTN